MHLYSESDVWPSQIDLIDDGDPPNATNTNTSPEGLADRTKFAAARTFCGGLVASVWNGSTTGDLTAIAVPLEFETRTIPGLGTFVYRSGAANVVDGLTVVNGPAGVGRWLRTDYARRVETYIASWDGGTAGGSITTLATGGGNFQDPGGRHAGTANGYNLATSAAFNLRANDIVDVSWACAFLAGGSAGATADPVIGVALNNAGSLTWMPGAIERGFQTTADTVNGGTWNGGTLIATAGTINAFMMQLSRRTRFIVSGAAAAATFTFAAAVDVATASCTIRQGAYMQVTQYRVFV